jgi:hypothetical protein
MFLQKGILLCLIIIESLSLNSKIYFFKSKIYSVMRHCKNFDFINLPPTPPNNFNNINFNVNDENHNSTPFYAYTLFQSNHTAIKLIEYINDSKQNLSLKKLWEEQTKGESGLLIFLLPTLAVQLKLFYAIIPFFVDRLVQYLQPISLITSIVLLNSFGFNFIQTSLWSTIILGIFLFFYLPLLLLAMHY